jgi:photosystem II stability/assembly factor-like uncharacterized protein
MKHFKLFALALALFFTANAFSQWTFVGFVTNQGPIPSISVPSQNTLWIAGGTNTPQVWRSTNGGANFTNATGTGMTLDLFCIWAIDDNTAFVGDGGGAGGIGGNARFYKTTNGGSTWTTVLSTGGTLGFINGIVFSRSNPQFGIAQSDPPTGGGQPYWIAKTTDGGNTWSVTNPPGISGAASAQNSIICIDAMFYGFGLNAGVSRVSYTSNGGTTWVTQSLGIGGSFISGFAFHDNKQTGIAVSNTSLPNISRTTNASTWSTLNTGAAPTFTGYSHLTFIDGTNICYITSGVGSGGCVRRSLDGGATWATMTTSGLTGVCNINYKRVGNNVYLYATCTDGSVMKYTQDITGLDPENTSVPNSYALQQNYPNPFNPSTTIKFSVPNSGYVSLKVHDALGKVVKTVIDGDLTAGNYREIIDLTGLPSGVYFYSLISGDYKETKKMMLVK